MSGDVWPVGLPTRLRPVRVAGRGAQGVVWAARDTAGGRDVAVKLVDAPDAERFEVEARALARLRDVPGVVGILEVGRTPRGLGWMVTELIEGATLASRGEGTVAPAELATIGARLATGLAEAHARGVHHGDITPANVVVRTDGSAELIDFAMASMGTDGGTPGGCTPRFAAPERLRGASPDAASDVYALAATLGWAATFANTAPGAAPVVAPDDGSDEEPGLAELRGALDTATAEESVRRPAASWLAERCSWVLGGGR